MPENVFVSVEFVFLKVTHQSKQFSISIIYLPYGKDWISLINIKNKQTQPTNQPTNQTPRILFSFHVSLGYIAELHIILI